ncbi:DUF7882 family protein [Microbacterium sp. NPDC055683]
MGRFIYGSGGDSVDIDDRALAHLRIVVMNKLRRSEPFMFDASLGEGTGRRSFWLHPSVPLQFQFSGGRSPRLNRLWLDELMKAASGPSGLTIMPEPIEPADDQHGSDAV